MILLAMASSMLIPSFCVLVTAFARGRVISKCPACRSERIRHSWLQTFDKLFALLIVPYRCESCRQRFYARR